MEQTIRGRCPTHPGAILREDVLSAMGVTVSAFAAGLGVSRQMVHGILAERHGISPEMALRLGGYLGNGAALWMDMQVKHDLYLAEVKLGGNLPARAAQLHAQ